MLACLADLSPLPSPLLSSADGSNPWFRLPTSRSSRNLSLLSTSSSAADLDAGSNLLSSSAGSDTTAAIMESPPFDNGSVRLMIPSPTFRRLSNNLPSPKFMIHSPDSVLITKSGESIQAAMAASQKRRTYQTLRTSISHPLSIEDTSTGSPRAVSDFVPEPTTTEKTVKREVESQNRNVSDGSHPKEDASRTQLRREPNLAASRGLVDNNVAAPPTPPPSSQGADSSDGEDQAMPLVRRETYAADLIRTDPGQGVQRRKWRAVRELGEGTFSKVVLAEEVLTQAEKDDTEAFHANETDTVAEAVSRKARSKFVAVKIVLHGPAGGASEERIASSLERELGILKEVHHPSLIRLDAFSNEKTRALLVLRYCPGGDLFEMAADHRDVMTVPVVRRIFSELVAATRYLHEKLIVHRDIKLESTFTD